MILKDEYYLKTSKLFYQNQFHIYSYYFYKFKPKLQAINL